MKNTEIYPTYPMKKRSLKGVLLRCVALLMVLGTTLPAMAQTANYAYIFYNATYGYLINDGGNPGVSTTFNKNAIWVANNTMGGTSRNVRSYTDNTKYFTGSNGSNNNTNGTFSLGTTNNQWRIVDNYLNRAGNNRGYVRYNGTGFIVNSSTTEQNFTGQTITVNRQTAANPTISITTAAGLSSGGIQLTCNITGTYSPEYYYASVRNYNNDATQTYYYWTTTTNATTTNPTITDWTGATLTWTVTTGGTYASVDANGLVTITANPTGNIVVRLGVSKGGYTNANAATITLTRAAIAQGTNTVTVITSPSINPISAALYYNEGSQSFTASASATATTSTIPAHTTLTGGGNTYYYYDGTLYTNSNDFSTTEDTHPAVTLNWSLSGAAATYLTRTPATGTSTTVTHSTQSPSDQTATLTVTASATGASNKTATATVTAYGPMVAPTITRSGNTITLSASNAGATIYYTTDGSTPTANSTPYTGSFNLTTSPTTVKAIAIRDGHSSTVATETFQIQLLAPVITVSNTGLATITAEAGATIHYTTDGSTPTASSPTYSAPVQLTNPQIIMAIAARVNYTTSDVAMADYITSGISDSKLIIDDREDHTWTYYSAKPDTDYPDQLRSPDPRNVKITYRGGSVNNASAAAVSATEAQNEFVYYKTIEKKAWGQDEGRWLTGNYAYKVIPNPFQKRPRTNGSTGMNGFYGFAGWRIVSGGEYINGHNNNNVLSLEEKINFVNLDNNYTPNCMSAEIVFEATWTAATVVAVNANVSGDNGLPAGGTYETNFIVVSGNDRTVTGMTRAATVMGCYPDGSGATGTRLSTVTGSANDLKIENINLGTGGSDFTANTGWLIVGRGCTGTVRRVIGNTGQVKIRIESGIYNFINPMSGGNNNNANNGLIVFGNDYDRATNDGLTSNDQYTDNSSRRKLRVINYVSYNGSGAQKESNDNRDEWMDITIKSGYYGYSADYSLYSTTASDNADGFGQGIGGNTDNASSYSAPDINGTTRNYTNLNASVNNTTYRWQRLMSFYVGRTRGGNYGGVNRVLVEGGELNSINGGGYRNTGAGFDVCYHFRMRGGWVKGAIYGTASSSQTNATTKQVITGGEINGWVAGACNGTDVDNAPGENLGDTYIYLGGTAELRSHRKDGVYNNAWGLVGGVEGGNLFASGRGTPATNAQPNRNYCGSSYKTYAVVADLSQVEQGVYGGGYIGVAQNSHIYITGGTTGKVFGGASTPTSTNNTWMTQTTDIRMYGGTVKEGIYGGHYEGTGNAGKIHQTVNITIDGGQVGVDANNTANIHGGGYGSGTSVGTDVTVTIGKAGAADSATIYGNVYGGGALGDVNTDGANNTTTVTLNKALINGNLFGGALGVGADVNGKITVTIAGGTVNGNVFGGGDAAAYSPNANFPVVNMTGGTVTNIFGGGNGDPNDATQETAKVTGNPQVTLSGNAHVTGNVYGGGNAAKVDGNTKVLIKD